MGSIFVGIVLFATGSSDQRSERGSVSGIRQESDSTTAEQRHGTFDMVASNLIVTDPGLGVVNASRLFEDISSVDPLSIDTTRIFSDCQRIGQSIEDVMKPKWFVVNEYTVVGVVASRNPLAKKPTVVASTFASLCSRSRRWA